MYELYDFSSPEVQEKIITHHIENVSSWWELGKDKINWKKYTEKFLRGLINNCPDKVRLDIHSNFDSVTRKTKCINRFNYRFVQYLIDANLFDWESGSELLAKFAFNNITSWYYRDKFNFTLSSMANLFKYCGTYLVVWWDNSIFFKIISEEDLSAMTSELYYEAYMDENKDENIKKLRCLLNAYYTILRSIYAKHRFKRAENLRKLSEYFVGEYGLGIFKYLNMLSEYTNYNFNSIDNFMTAEDFIWQSADEILEKLYYSPIKQMVIYGSEARILIERISKEKQMTTLDVKRDIFVNCLRTKNNCMIAFLLEDLELSKNFPGEDEKKAIAFNLFKSFSFKYNINNLENYWVETIFKRYKKDFRLHEKVILERLEHHSFLDYEIFAKLSEISEEYGNKYIDLYTIGYLINEEASAVSTLLDYVDPRFFDVPQFQKNMFCVKITQGAFSKISSFSNKEVIKYILKNCMHENIDFHIGFLEILSRSTELIDYEIKNEICTSERFKSSFEKMDLMIDIFGIKSVAENLSRDSAKYILNVYNKDVMDYLRENITSLFITFSNVSEDNEIFLNQLISLFMDDINWADVWPCILANDHAKEKLSKINISDILIKYPETFISEPSYRNILLTKIKSVDEITKLKGLNIISDEDFLHLMAIDEIMIDPNIINITNELIHWVFRQTSLFIYKILGSNIFPKILNKIFTNIPDDEQLTYISLIGKSISECGGKINKNSELQYFKPYVSELKSLFKRHVDKLNKDVFPYFLIFDDDSILDYLDSYFRNDVYTFMLKFISNSNETPMHYLMFSDNFLKYIMQEAPSEIYQLIGIRDLIRKISIINPTLNSIKPTSIYFHLVLLSFDIKTISWVNHEDITWLSENKKEDIITDMIRCVGSKRDIEIVCKFLDGYEIYPDKIAFYLATYTYIYFDDWWDPDKIVFNRNLNSALERFCYPFRKKWKKAMVLDTISKNKKEN